MNTSGTLRRGNAAVFVEKSDVLEDILDSIQNRPSYRPNSSSSLKPANSSSAVSSEDVQKRLLIQQLRLKDEQQTAVVKKNTQKYLERTSEMRDERFFQLSTDVEEARSFLDTVDKSIEVFDETKRNKTRRQFDDWNKNVHGPITVRLQFKASE